MQSGRGQDAELPQSIVVNCGVLDIRVALSQQSGRDSTGLGIGVIHSATAQGEQSQC